MKNHQYMNVLVIAFLYALSGCSSGGSADSHEDHSGHDESSHEESAHDDHDDHNDHDDHVDHNDHDEEGHDDHEDHSGHDESIHEESAHDDHDDHEDHDDHDDHNDHDEVGHDDHEDHSGHDESIHEESAHDDHDDHNDHEEEGLDDHTEGSVTQYDEDELAEFGIKFAVAKSGFLHETISLTGEVVLNQNRVAHVVTRANGICESVQQVIGDHVEAGDLLAIIESPELAGAKADYLARSAEAALAMMDLTRTESMHSNTIALLALIGVSPEVDQLQEKVGKLDLGARRGELVVAYVELQAAKSVYERERKLLDKEITSEYEFISAETNYNKAMAVFGSTRDELAFINQRELNAATRARIVADASLQAAELKLHAFGLTEEEVDHVENEMDDELARYAILSPSEGHIIEQHIVQGESIEVGEQIFIVTDLSNVWGELTIYQRDLGIVREGMTVRIGDKDVWIDYVSPILDEETRTTTARIELENSDGRWSPGMFIRGQYNAVNTRVGLLVPRSAIQVIENESVVFVETKDGIVVRHIVTGQSDLDSVEILSGLRTGERYVVSGSLAIKAELNKAALEHAGHAH